MLATEWLRLGSSEMEAAWEAKICLGLLETQGKCFHFDQWPRPLSSWSEEESGSHTPHRAKCKGGSLQCKSCFSPAAPCQRPSEHAALVGATGVLAWYQGRHVAPVSSIQTLAGCLCRSLLHSHCFPRLHTSTLDDKGRRRPWQHFSPLTIPNPLLTSPPPSPHPICIPSLRSGGPKTVLPPSPILPNTPNLPTASCLRRSRSMPAEALPNATTCYGPRPPLSQ